MKQVAYFLFLVGFIVMVNGAVSFFFRYNFITQKRYGPSLEPLYIMGAGIGILVLGMIVKTIADTISKAKSKE